MSRIIAVVLAGLLAAEWALQAGAGQPASPTPASEMQVYFQADAETGDLTQWNHDNGGGVYYASDSGILCNPLDKNTAGVLASKDVAHSGQYSFKFLLADPAKANHAKLMRWRIDRKEAYYSGWYYFDKNFKSRTGGVNVLQWKTLPGEADGSCEPTIVVECITHVDNIRQLRAYHWSVGQKKIPFRQPTVLKGSLISDAMYMPGVRAPIPDNTWVHVEAYYRSDREDGQFILWQDGQELINVRGINTQDSARPSKNPFIMFGVGNYSAQQDNPNLLLYIDDFMVTSQRTWPMWQSKAQSTAPAK